MIHSLLVCLTCTVLLLVQLLAYDANAGNGTMVVIPDIQQQASVINGQWQVSDTVTEQLVAATDTKLDRSDRRSTTGSSDRHSTTRPQPSPTERQDNSSHCR